MSASRKRKRRQSPGDLDDTDERSAKRRRLSGDLNRRQTPSPVPEEEEDSPISPPRSTPPLDSSTPSAPTPHSDSGPIERDSDSPGPTPDSTLPLSHPGLAAIPSPSSPVVDANTGDDPDAAPDEQLRTGFDMDPPTPTLAFELPFADPADSDPVTLAGIRLSEEEEGEEQAGWEEGEVDEDDDDDAIDVAEFTEEYASLSLFRRMQLFLFETRPWFGMSVLLISVAVLALCFAFMISSFKSVPEAGDRSGSGSGSGSVGVGVDGGEVAGLDLEALQDLRDAVSAQERVIAELSSSLRQWKSEQAAIEKLQDSLAGLRTVLDKVKAKEPVDDVSSEDLREMERRMNESLSKLGEDMVRILLYEDRIQLLENPASDGDGDGDGSDSSAPPEIDLDQLWKQVSNLFDADFRSAVDDLSKLQDIVASRLGLIQNHMKSLQNRVEEQHGELGQLGALVAVGTSADDAKKIVKDLMKQDDQVISRMTDILQKFMLKTIEETGEAPSAAAITALVRKQLAIFQNDGINRTDYALARIGGAVVAHTAPFTGRSTPWLFKYLPMPWFRTKPWWFQGESDPNVVITSRLRYVVGDCFALAGSKPHIVIRAAGPVIPDGFSIDHVSPDLTPDRTTAPRVFEVWGHEDATMTSPAEFLERYEYDLSSVIQSFNYSGTGKAYHVYTFRFLSNHGNEDYTCLYRVRIHGDLQIRSVEATA